MLWFFSGPQGLELDYLSVGYTAYFEYCFGVDVALGYGFFNAVFAYHVYDG